MLSLEEWRFDFDITAQEAISGQLMGDLWHVAIEWAEANRLEVGGGSHPTSPYVDQAARSWHFGFCLCVMRDGQSIPASQASELLLLLRGWCVSRGFDFSGRFRAYTPEESEPGT